MKRYAILLMLVPALAWGLTLEEAIQTALSQHYQVTTLQWDALASAHAVQVQEEAFRPQWQWQAQSGYTGLRAADQQTVELATGPSMQWKGKWGTQLAVELQQSAGRHASTSTHMRLEQALRKGSSAQVNENALVQARTAAQVQSLDAYQTRTQIVQGVIQAYYAWERAQMREHLQVQMLRAAERLVEVIEQRIAAGRLPAMDRAQPEAQRSRQAHLHRQAQQQVQNAYWQLCAQMGVETLPISKDQEYPQTVWPVLQEQAYYLEQAQHASVTLEKLSLELEQAKRQQAVAEDSKRSELALVLQGTLKGDSNGNIGSSVQHYLDNRQGSWSTQLQWRWPINAKATREQPVINATVTLEKLKLQQEEARRQQRLKIQQLWQEASSQYEQLALQEQSVALAKTAWENAQEKFDVGRTALFEVLSLEERWFAEAQSYVDAQTQYALALYQLEQHAGLLLERWE